MKHSGCIIDTSNLVAHAHSYEMLDHLVNVFDVNCIVSVGNERLYSELGIRYKNRPGISIVKVPKSGGVSFPTLLSYFR